MINVGGFYFKGGEWRVVRGSGPIKCGIIKLEHRLPVISVILVDVRESVSNDLLTGWVERWVSSLFSGLTMTNCLSLFSDR